MKDCGCAGRRAKISALARRILGCRDSAFASHTAAVLDMLAAKQDEELEIALEVEREIEFTRQMRADELNMGRE
jgi:hypothetical protein